ncbi:MAG: asparagine synthase (glutamine-hydrolyzing) [Pseudomonadota bacterium]
MCGIAGSAHFNPELVDASTMMKAIAAMSTRGPDGRGIAQYDVNGGTVWLAHSRLSVIDLSNAGHQPMSSACARFAIVFNGEIYNYKELRAELASLGHAFVSASDTEVLLQAWAEWGPATLQRLVGMFAFAVLDQQRQTLTLVRDPFGIKPLFYSKQGNGISFASELSAMKVLSGSKPSLNAQRAYDYLVHGDYDTSSDTFVQDAYTLSPGHVLTFELETRSAAVHRWWQPIVQPVQRLSLDEAAQMLRAKFLDSVRLQLRSDVPLGAALSGGIDSSAVVCAMRYLEPDAQVNTFSFIAEGSDASEERWIDLVNAHTQATGHKVAIQPGELAADLDDLIAAQGEPFGSTSIYAQYRVFKLARESGVTVTLDGQGADELLAGYSGYPAKRAHSLLDEGHWAGALRFLHQWAQWPGRTLAEGVKATLAEYMNDTVFQSMRQVNGEHSCPSWLDANALHDLGVKVQFPRHAAELSTAGRRVVAELAQTLVGAGLPALLRHGDRNSMRFSVESRVPFLTTDLADFLLTLPEEYLISAQGETKHIFRMAMRGIVPDVVLNRRDKIGFATPERNWLLQMAPQVREWLREPIDVPFFKQAEVLRSFDAVVSGKLPFSWQVWRWINFTRWHARHMGR